MRKIIVTSPSRQKPKYEDVVLNRILRAYPEQVTKREFLSAIQLYRAGDEEVCEE